MTIDQLQRINGTKLPTSQTMNSKLQQLFLGVISIELYLVVEYCLNMVSTFLFCTSNIQVLLDVH